MDRIPKILVVDDEEIVIRSTIRSLETEGYQLDSARSGETALTLITRNEYDLVITDLMMPGISGLELLRQIREHHPDVTVVMFTGFATVDSAREALKMGAFDYVPKPFTPHELREVVKNALAAGPSNSEAKMMDLLAIVSHEMKSPTSAIHTTAEYLQDGGPGNLDPEQQKFVESILRNCGYLEDTIRNFLDLAQMEMDDIGSFKVDTDFVDDVILPIVNLPEHAANLKGMKIITRLDVKPVLHGDPNLLKIVMTNLINNAIKYGSPKTEIAVSLVESEGGCMLGVFNQGVGISPEDIENRLFKKFSRLKQRGTEGIKGSGLGLYMCKKIIDKHGGKIWAESEPGRWVKFNIFLPI